MTEYVTNKLKTWFLGHYAGKFYVLEVDNLGRLKVVLTNADVVTIQQPATRETFRTSRYKSPMPTIDRISATASAGNNYVNSPAVPAGTVWILHKASARNLTRAITLINIDLLSGSDVCNVGNLINPAASQSVHMSGGEAFLPAGAYVRGEFIGCSLKDELLLELNYTPVALES